MKTIHLAIDPDTDPDEEEESSSNDVVGDLYDSCWDSDDDTESS